MACCNADQSEDGNELEFLCERQRKGVPLVWKNGSFCEVPVTVEAIVHVSASEYRFLFAEGRSQYGLLTSRSVRDSQND